MQKTEGGKKKQQQWGNTARKKKMGWKDIYAHGGEGQSVTTYIKPINADINLQEQHTRTNTNKDFTVCWREAEPLIKMGICLACVHVCREPTGLLMREQGRCGVMVIEKMIGS